MKRRELKLPEDPVFEALDPWGRQFMRALWLPDRLNPFARWGLEIVALVSFGMFQHIKVIPAFQMMLEDFEAGRYRKKHTIVVDSSGNTAHAVSRLAPAFGLREVKVVVASDIPDNKSAIFKAFRTTVDFSVTVMQVGNVAAVARREGNLPGHYHLNQYGHSGNPKGHRRFTGPEIDRLLLGKYNVSVIAVGLGSGGTALGVASYLAERSPRTVVVGVRPKLGEQVPGTRDKKRMEDVVTLPWHRAIRTVVDVSRRDAFIEARRLWDWIEPQPGPSSGLAFRGLVEYLTHLPQKERAALTRTVAAFICPDGCWPYLDIFRSELDPDW